MRKVRVAVGFPWYKGPDEHSFISHLALQHYLGKLEERSRYPRHLHGNVPLTETMDAEIAMIDEAAKEEVELDFCFSAATNIGLTGMAREQVAAMAVDMGADVMFSYDYDMIFGPATFTRLLCDVLAPEPDVPIVAALAFGGRRPLGPVIYSVKFPPNGVPHFEMVMDYKRDALQKVEAFGTGVFMVRTEVFKAIPQPWFQVNSAMGEDLFFTGVRCHDHNIPVYVDTRAKTLHKPTVIPNWHGEELFDMERANGK